MTKEISKEDEDIIGMLIKEKGKLCVSIILPNHRQLPDLETSHESITKAVEEAITLITKNPSADTEYIINSLRTTLPIIYFNKNHSGIGIYVSKKVCLFTTFPFSVIRKITVGERFELNELIYKKQYFFSYLVLHMDKKGFHLYSGKEKQIKEIIINELSPESEEVFNLSSPTSNSSITSNISSINHTKTKFIFSQNSFESFLSGVDEVLTTYKHEAEIIILCGLKEIISAFLNRTQHINKVISVIHGSYEWFKSDINNIAWDAIELYVQKKMLEEISEYEEKNGEGLTEEGLHSVKQAVADGRAEKLLIEKEYLYRSYFNLKNEEDFNFTDEPPSIQIEDVNEIIDLILINKGKVVFVERGMLNHHHGIALITIY